MIHRRLFLGGLLAGAAAPAIVRAASLMPVVSTAIRIPDFILDCEWGYGSGHLLRGNTLNLSHRRYLDLGRGRELLLHAREASFLVTGAATLQGDTVRNLMKRGLLIPTSFK